MKHMALDHSTKAVKGNSDNLSPNCSEQKRVVINNIHGEKLVGILHETGSRELVIICHGFRSSKDRIPMVNLAAAFERENISAFRFDFTGNGESEGSFQYGNYKHEAEDLREVVKYFVGKKRFVMAIIGHSKGGNAAIIYASRYNDVQTVVNVSGRFDLAKGIEGRLGKNFQQKIDQYGFIDVMNRRGKIEYRVTKKSLTDRLTTDTLASCRLIPQNCRVLTVHGSMDEIVPLEDAIKFAEYTSNHHLQIIEGADHEYTNHQVELASIILNFVRIDLRNEGSDSEEELSSRCSRIKNFPGPRL